MPLLSRRQIGEARRQFLQAGRIYLVHDRSALAGANHQATNPKRAEAVAHYLLLRAQRLAQSGHVPRAGCQCLQDA